VQLTLRVARPVRSAIKMFLLFVCVARRKPASSIDCTSAEWDSGGVACTLLYTCLQNGPSCCSKHTACVRQILVAFFWLMSSIISTKLRSLSSDEYLSMKEFLVQKIILFTEVIKYIYEIIVRSSFHCSSLQ